LLTAALSSAKAKYKKALDEIPNPDRITDNVVKTLDVLSKELGLTGNQTNKLEVEVLGNSVRKILKKQKEEVKQKYNDYLRRAKEQFKLKKWDKAFRFTEAAIDTDPMELDGLQLKLEILEKQKVWEQAITTASRCLRLDPGNDDIRYKRALCHLENRNNTAALADFKTPLSSVPKTFNRVTDDLKKQEKWELVIAAYSCYLQLEPGNDAIRYERALCHLENRSYTEALADFDHVLSVDSQVKKHRFRWRAVAKYHLDDVAGAVDDLELAASDPVGCTSDGTPAVAVWTITGILFSYLEKFTKAKEYLSEALVMRGKVGIITGRFWLYFNQRNKNGALKKGSVKLPPPAAGTELESFYDFVQLVLWDVCHALNPDSLADAVEQFDVAVQESTRKISDDVYEKLIRQERNSTFGVEVVKRFARTGRPEEAIKWIVRLIADLNIDIPELQGCSEIKRSSALRKYLQLKFSFKTAYGAFGDIIYNTSLKVVNCSPFPLTKVVISIKVTRTDGKVKRATQEEKILGIDKSTSLRNTSCLADPGIFGWNIKNVQVTLDSQQGRDQRVE
jgi:tetratricopeptide (TPR) repeat protein